MARGLSIHLGLNGVDPNAYGGWPGTLSGCVNDAQSMQQIAQAGGYQTRTILNQDATCANMIAAINSAASTLQSGDILLLTYSGHGGQTPDPTGQEATGMNSTWCLYDRQVVDDELYALWAHFKAGVRIFVLSDSCHSGTVTREVQYAYALQGNDHLARAYGSAGPSIRYRNMPLDVNQKDYHNRQLMYDTIATYTPKDVAVAATVLLISGCQDNQLSADGARNGLFTEKLLNVWSNGGFHGTYSQFRQAIVAQMPPTQCPNYYVVGAGNTTFEGQQPFSIGGGTSQTSGGGLPGTSSWGTTQGGGTQSGGTQSGGTQSGGTQSGGTQSGGTQSGGTQSGGGDWTSGQGGNQSQGGGDQSGGWGDQSGSGGDQSGGWGDQSGSGGDQSGGWGDQSGSGGDQSGGWGDSSGSSGDQSGWGDQSGSDSGWGDSSGDQSGSDQSGWGDQSGSGDQSGDSGSDSGWGDQGSSGGDGSGGWSDTSGGDQSGSGGDSGSGWGDSGSGWSDEGQG